MATVKNAIWVFVDNKGPCTLNDNAQENMVALARECGKGQRIERLVAHQLAWLAQESGLDGVIASPQKIQGGERWKSLE